VTALTGSPVLLELGRALEHGRRDERLGLALEARDCLLLYRRIDFAAI
jgi:hypothetical protein